MHKRKIAAAIAAACMTVTMAVPVSFADMADPGSYYSLDACDLTNEYDSIGVMGDHTGDNGRSVRLRTEKGSHLVTVYFSSDHYPGYSLFLTGTKIELADDSHLKISLPADLPISERKDEIEYSNYMKSLYPKSDDERIRNSLRWSETIPSSYGLTASDVLSGNFHIEIIESGDGYEDREKNGMEPMHITLSDWNGNSCTADYIDRTYSAEMLRDMIDGAGELGRANYGMNLPNPAGTGKPLYQMKESEMGRSLTDAEEDEASTRRAGAEYLRWTREHDPDTYDSIMKDAERFNMKFVTYVRSNDPDLYSDVISAAVRSGRTLLTDPEYMQSNYPEIYKDVEKELERNTSDTKENTEGKTDGARRFSDVAPDSYYSRAIDWAAGKNIAAGTGDSTFSPDQSCTRAQAVTMLYRAAGSPEADKDLKFRDVSADDYYAEAVGWAVKNGITAGTGPAAFSPDQKCTRAQIIAMLYRSAGSPAVSDGSESFSDVSPDAYYSDAVAWSMGRKIASGTGSGRFSPDRDCSRGDIVTLIYRYNN